jgi:ABC-type sulfate transport system substrate-binding protein
LLVIARNVRTDRRPLVEAFVSFLWSPAAQQTFSRYGFRSPGDSVIEDPFRIDDLGGWRAARSDILDGTWRPVRKELGR